MDTLAHLLFAPWLHLSPLAFFGLVLLAMTTRDWLGVNGWRVPWAALIAWEWVVCHTRGHRAPTQGWCGRCGRYTGRRLA